MKKLKGFLVLLLAAGLVLTSSPLLADEDEDDASTEILLELASGVDVSLIEQRYSVTLVESLPELGYWKVRITPGDDIQSVVSRMEGDPDLTEVERHHELDIPEGVQRSIPDLGIVATLDDFINQPALTTIRLAPAQVRYRGSGVTVAVLDTGINFSHPEVSGMLVIPGRDFVDGGVSTEPRGDDLDNDGDGLVDEALHHGTYVTGLLRAVAPGIRVLPVRVLDADGVGTAFGLARGILYAAASGADVINLSLAVAEDSLIVERAVEEALSRGVIVVAAAGNSGQDQVLYPARDSDVIAVAAVDDALHKSSFSSYGSEVDLSAPGQDLLSTFGGSDFASWEGTSFATPLVSGAVALVLDKYPGLGFEDVRDVLVETAQPDQNSSQYEGLMGGGVLDLDAVTLARTRHTASLEARGGGGATEFVWSPVLEATHYDIVRGDVSELSRDTFGDPVATALGALECLANDLQSASLSDPTVPAEGQTFFYVFRDNGSGGYDLPGGPERSGGEADCPKH